MGTPRQHWSHRVLTLEVEDLLLLTVTPFLPVLLWFRVHELGWL